MARATYFTHFPTKESLLVEYHGRLLDRQLAWLDELGGAGLTARSFFEAHFARAAELAETEGDRFRELVRNLLSNPVVMAAEQDRSGVIVTAYGGVLEEGRRRGELRGDVNVAAAVRLIAGVWTLSVIEWTYAPGGMDLSQSVTEKLDTLFRGLAAQP